MKASGNSSLSGSKQTPKAPNNPIKSKATSSKVDSSNSKISSKSSEPNKGNRQNASPPKTTAKEKKPKKSPNILSRLEECERSGQHFIDISDLNLSTLPREALIVPAIRELKAFGNRFKEMPSLTHYKNLEMLNFSRNGMTSLNNAGISQLSCLRVVDLCRNELTSLPDEISLLLMLEELVFHRNKIVALPDGLRNLKSLRKVDGSHNSIVNVGDLFETSLNMEYLDLSNNPRLNVDGMSPRTRRLHEKHTLMASKSARRALITRALGIQRDVLTREQQLVFQAVYRSEKESTINEYP